MTRVAIVVAMEREIVPLVRDWKQVPLVRGDHQFTAYENDEVVAVAGGIGCSSAEQAARAAMEKYKPQIMVSAGLAGALIRTLKVANIVVPSIVIDAQSGAEYRCDSFPALISGGVLVSSPEIAGTESKQELVERFHGLLVDMEAAGVAHVARESGAKLLCVKAISDEFEFSMPPLGQFVDNHGSFQVSRFARWTALRPQYWAATLRLGRNSRQASQALADWFRANLADTLREASVVTLDGAEHLKK